MMNRWTRNTRTHYDEEKCA